jgi:hypothetical protein
VRIGLSAPTLLLDSLLYLEKAGRVREGGMRKPNPGDFIWDDAAIARLQGLWLAGYSSGECARQLGVSRSAAIGKINRLGLMRRARPRLPVMARASARMLLKATEHPEQAIPVPKPVPEKPPRKRHLRQNKRPLPPPEPYQAPPPPPAPPPGSYRLLDLRHNSCRWPEGDGPIYVFCGRPQASQSSYCPEHARLSLSHGSQRDFDRMAAQALGGKLFASRAGIEQ